MTARNDPLFTLHNRLRLDVIADARRDIGPHDERAHNWHKVVAPPVDFDRRWS